MTGWKALKRLLRRLLSSFTDTPRDTSEARRRVQDGYDAPTATVNVYSQTKLRKKNGIAPEKKASLVLANALDAAHINYEIRWGYDETYEPPVDGIYEKDFKSIYWWDGKNSYSDADANVLLMHDRGGVTVGNSALVGAQNITQFTDVRESLPASESVGLHAMVHETGHALGVAGDANQTAEGAQTYGNAWTENGYWHRTAVVSTAKQTTNACGDGIAANDGNLPVMLHNRYSDCAIQKITEHLNST